MHRSTAYKIRYWGGGGRKVLNIFLQLDSTDVLRKNNTAEKETMAWWFITKIRQP